VSPTIAFALVLREGGSSFDRAAVEAMLSRYHAVSTVTIGEADI